MANTIRLKRKLTGAPSSLAFGEAAYSEGNDILYIGLNDNSVHAIGGRGFFAPLNSPALTGTPTAPTASLSDSSTKLATTEFVADKIAEQLTGLTLGSAMPTAHLGTTANLTSATYDNDGGTSLRGQITGAPTTLDDVSVTDDMIILVLHGVGGSPDSSAGGWYIATDATSGTWDRHPGFDADSDLESGKFGWIAYGTTNGKSAYLNTNALGDTLGGASGDAITWQRINGAGQLSGASNRISISGNQIDIHASYTGQASITTLGTISAGTWNGSTVGVAYGGTGATTLTGLVKGNGTSAFTAAVANTDYCAAAGGTQVTTLGTITTGTWNGTAVTVPYGGTGATTLTGIVKGNGTSAFTAAVDGTDYLSPNATIDGGTW